MNVKLLFLSKALPSEIHFLLFFSFSPPVFSLSSTPLPFNFTLYHFLSLINASFPQKAN